MGSKTRKPRRGGVSRSTLARRYHSDVIPVGMNPNPFVLRQYKRRLNSVRKSLDEQASKEFRKAFSEEPVRRQVDVDYLPQPTPLKTEPKREVDRKLSIMKMDPDFYDGLDVYHKIKIIDEPTYKLSLFFHADHCYFIEHNLITKKAWMSQDFRDRKRALYVYRSGGLMWIQEVAIE
jgi:hypothetical protein